MSVNRVLQIVSNETKDDVCKLDIVTPEMFAKTFIENAKKHNLQIDDTVKEYIDNKMNEFIEIQNKTTKNVDMLSKTTSKAIEAMKENDTEAMDKVLKETNKLKKEIDKLKESLYKDELTSVHNRKWLYDNILNEEHKFIKDGTMAMIDLNYFKLVNDTYGHIVGDKVLIFIASQLKKSKGEVVRYGGDEFMILFDKSITAKSVTKTLTKIRNEIHGKILKAKDSEFRVSFSFGADSYKADETFENVTERIDKIMYDDKVNIKKLIKGIDV
jgi:diguanylate cyclase (GGDEF)-like protein